jgi:FtsP/CotA-like multicopper oxidase with cupredoxin domain
LPAVPHKLVLLEIPRDSTAGERAPVFAPTVTDAGNLSAPAARGGPGGMLLLHQGEPTTVRVINHSAEHTAIHWHGMELENLYDGVVGLGGTPGQHTLAIAPGMGFDARMTPPRAGTFIYHTHMMEVRQMQGGLYGPMIVLPAGAAWDGAHDHVFILGTRTGTGAVLNGARVAPTIEFEAGAVHRLRLINITTGTPGGQFRLVRSDSSVMSWTHLAKDAIDLPASRRVATRAQQPVAMGETYDMLITPLEPGELRLEARSAVGALLAYQPIRVVLRRP